MKKIKIQISCLVFVFVGFLIQNTNGQDNISAIGVPSTSYVSTWETISAINDGFEPSSSADDSHDAYGNWQNGVTNQWNWVQYSFDKLYNIYESDVYWWGDGNGIVIPYETYLMYWDVISQTWKRFDNAVGNGVEADKYNVTKFDTTLTNKIRIYCISTIAQGILEWKVFGKLGEQIPLQSIVSIDKALEKNSTSTITLEAKNANGIAVSGYIFKLNVDITNALSAVTESYNINSIDIASDTMGVLLLPTDAQGKTSFTVTIPLSIDPRDGLIINIAFNDGKTKLGSHSIFEVGIVPPLLTPDNSANTVDNDIEISFPENTNWRNAITAVKADNIVLDSNDYEITSGLIKLKPSSGNALITKSGAKQISVVATGYDDAIVTQSIQTGVINALKSGVNGKFKLYRPSTTRIEVKAVDQFGNSIAGYTFKCDANAVNLDTTTGEVYIIDSSEVEGTTGISGQTLAITNSKGIAIISVSVPATVDINDGVKLQIRLSDGITNVGEQFQYIHKEGEKSAYVDRGTKATKDWNWEQTAQSDNFTLFWGSLTGSDPKNPSGGGPSFDPNVILQELENFYTFYFDSMKFIPNHDSGNMAKYKFIIILNNTWARSQYQGNTPTGGSSDGVIGAMWIPPTSSNGFVMAHEFAHSACAMIPIQYPGRGIKNRDDNHVVGMFWEGTANFMAYLATGAFGNISPATFINTAMAQYLSTHRHYETVALQLYVCDHYGYEGFSKLWLSALSGDHPFEAMMRAQSMTREQMNDEACNYAMHNVKWDYTFFDLGNKFRSQIANYSPTVIGREFTILDSLKSKPGRYIVPRQLAPADYGYNVIPLYPDNNTTSIKVKFFGYENEPAAGAGWRYGFVAVDKSGNPRYSEPFSKEDAVAGFVLQSTDSSIYLVVIATPDVSHSYVWDPGWPRIYRYPYSLEFEGAVPAGHKVGYNSKKSIYAGAPHSNGGGWVASTAQVDASVYVGPNAQVLGKAVVTGNARIEGFAIVSDNAKVSDDAIIKDHCIVGTTAQVYDNAIIEKCARVYGGKIYGDAVITGSAMVFNSTVYGTAVVRDIAEINGAKLSGNIVVGGDVDTYGTCAKGIYLQDNRTCDGKIISLANTDINPELEENVFPNGEIPSPAMNLSYSDITDKSVVLKWDEPESLSPIISYVVVNGTNGVGMSSVNTDTVTGLKANKTYSLCVKAIDARGNISSSSDTVTFTTQVTGVASTEMLAQVKVFPNPSSDIINIETEDNNLSQISVVDYLGRNVCVKAFYGKLKLQKQEIGNEGIYFLIISNSKGKYIQKLSIQ